jgi:hypothetical protein
VPTPRAEVAGEKHGARSAECRRKKRKRIMAKKVAPKAVKGSSSKNAPKTQAVKKPSKDLVEAVRKGEIKLPVVGGKSAGKTETDKPVETAKSKVHTMEAPAAAPVIPITAAPAPVAVPAVKKEPADRSDAAKRAWVTIRANRAAAAAAKAS